MTHFDSINPGYFSVLNLSPIPYRIKVGGLIHYENSSFEVTKEVKDYIEGNMIEYELQMGEGLVVPNNILHYGMENPSKEESIFVLHSTYISTPKNSDLRIIQEKKNKKK